MKKPHVLKADSGPFLAVWVGANRMKLVRPGFVARMEAELQANAIKGDWAQWKPSSFESLQELRHHLRKLEDAFQRREWEAVEEYSADCANVLMKIHECFGRSGS
jgi:hypothetical protein